MCDASEEVCGPIWIKLETKFRTQPKTTGAIDLDCITKKSYLKKGAENVTYKISLIIV